MAQYRTNKKAKIKAVTTKAVMMEDVLDPLDWQFRVMRESNIDAISLGDSGEFHSAIDPSMAEKVVASEPAVKTVALKSPIILGAAMESNKENPV